MDSTMPQQPASSELPSTPDDAQSEPSPSVSQSSSPESMPKPLSTNTQNGDMAAPLSPSSPLGPTTAARRPGPFPSRASGLNSDIQAKMKAFSLSRQGAPPPSAHNMRQQAAGPGGFVGGPMAGPSPGSPNPAANLRLPTGLKRPNAPSFGSAPSLSAGSPRTSNARGPMGGLAAKRGLKPGGLKLSDAQKPAPAGQEPEKQVTGSQFTKYANIIDTQKGTLNFKNKAVIHGSGIDFAEGSTFSISLDEVDTIAELGKGNYGTVFLVRHARPKMRRPGLGLRGNMVRHSSPSVVKQDDDNTGSNTPTTGTSGLVMAMKEIRLELEDSKFAAIIMELDILHRCISPFIIDFYGAFFQEGSVYICIEYMDGGSIDKLYGDGVPEGVLKKITLSTVMGLKYLKDEHNIIHRDVKPTNILVNTRGQVKICDFGVSGNLVASIAKTNIGCQSYMAPERISGGGMAQVGANGGGTYSVQSDIWSLGLSIIECALGRYPYPPETYDNIFSQLSAIVDGDPPDLPADRFSEAAIDFVRGCLNKIPRLRPTYAMLLRHAWLAPLMKPPTISEDEEGEQAAEAGADSSSAGDGVPETADKEVAEWVKAALERKMAGKMAVSKKPALHEAPLDAVPGNSSPLLTQREVLPRADEDDVAEVAPNAGVPVDSPDLTAAKVDGLDFA
ncbi:Protein kinase wis1 [Exophiala dermatitidis]